MASAQSEPSDLITTEQAAAELGVTRRRVQALIAAGRLRAERYGRVLLVRAADLDQVRERPPGRPAGKAIDKEAAKPTKKNPKNPPGRA